MMLSDPSDPLVVNRIPECRQANRNNGKILPRASIGYLVIHRTDLDTYDAQANPHPMPNDLLDGPALASRFANPGLGTGGLIPYHFLLCANPDRWTIEQMLPLSIRGAHAIGFNWRGIGIAAVGDFRRQAPPSGQYDRLAQLVALLAPINGGLIVAGHTDLPGAAADPNKVCPGACLPVKVLAAKALNMLPDNWKQWSTEEINLRLVAAGVGL